MNLAILKFHDLPYIKNGHATSISCLDMERLSSKFSDDIFALFTLFYLVKVWELSNQEQFVRPVYKYPFECKAPCIFCPLFFWNFTILSVTDPISQMTWKNQLLLRSLKWGLKHEPCITVIVLFDFMYDWAVVVFDIVNLEIAHLLWFLNDLFIG